MLNTAVIKQAKSVDLVAIVERDLGQEGRRSGRWVMFCCPFHSDTNPSLGVTNGDGIMQGAHFECFACGEKGSAIDWTMKRQGLEFGEATHVLTGTRAADISVEVEKPAGYHSARDQGQPPGEMWQRRAAELVERAQDYLWSEKGWNQAVGWESSEGVRKLSPVDWLFSRGLNETTLKTWQIGYIPMTFEENPEKWGLQGGRKVFIQQGVLIPCLLNNEAWYLKIRVNKPSKQTKGKDKYAQVRGITGQALFMSQTILPDVDTVVMTEGEFDALLLWQEIDGQAGVVTLGSASSRLKGLDMLTWGLYLLKVKHWLLAFDADAAGDGGAKEHDWLKGARRISPQMIQEGDKDITDYFLSGGDLRAWIQSELSK